jgi:prepilin-type N-terminal cleavage/methylation domain-containing protein
MKVKTNTLKDILRENRGVTLTELLVASVMIGIVMIGVASYSGSITRLQGSTNRSTIVAMRTKAVMARIVEDAYSAVGDNENCGKDDDGVPEWNLNCGWGIRGFELGPRKSICFRHDVNVTPENYSDDAWTCYLKAPTGGPSRLFLCGGPPTLPANVPVKNNGDCNANGGSEELLTFDPAENNFYQVVENAAGQLEYVEITISNIYNRIPAEHPMTNPTYSITTRVSPPGHSR